MHSTADGFSKSSTWVRKLVFDIHLDLNMFGTKMEGGIPPVSVGFNRHMFWLKKDMFIILYGNVSRRLMPQWMSQCLTILLGQMMVRHEIVGFQILRQNPFFRWTCPKSLTRSGGQPMGELRRKDIPMLYSRGQWFCFVVGRFWHPKGFSCTTVCLATIRSSHVKNCSEARHLDMSHGEISAAVIFQLPCAQVIFKHAEFQLHFACPEGGSIGFKELGPGRGNPWIWTEGNKNDERFKRFGHHVAQIKNCSWLVV